jgi:hypothetical protein
MKAAEQSRVRLRRVEGIEMMQHLVQSWTSSCRMCTIPSPVLVDGNIPKCAPCVLDGFLKHECISALILFDRFPKEVIIATLDPCVVHPT